MKEKKFIRSPLRYPGSKYKLNNIIIKLLKSNNLNPELFIEPFCGGSNVSLYLLQTNTVQKIGLIEKDPLVVSFWKTLFYETDWLLKEIDKIDISLDKWKMYKKYNPSKTRNKALKCLFLNRTNFSGILKAGPIGGQKQESDYKIDCRFNKKNIAFRIKELAEYRDRVAFIEEGDYLEVLKRKKSELPISTFIYFDPPYVNKAKNIYNFYFNEEDHVILRDYIKELKVDWLLSYDYDSSIECLYKDSKIFRKGCFEIIYTISDTKRIKMKEFLASNFNLNNL